MRITITARHCTITDELRDRARDLVERLGKVASRPQHAQVVFTDDHGEAAVEIALRVPRGRVQVAKAQAGDHRTALDRATARVRRQLLAVKIRRPRPAREPA